MSSLAWISVLLGTGLAVVPLLVRRLARRQPRTQVASATDCNLQRLSATGGVIDSSQQAISVSAGPASSGNRRQTGAVASGTEPGDGRAVNAEANFERGQTARRTVAEPPIITGSSSGRYHGLAIIEDLPLTRTEPDSTSANDCEEYSTRLDQQNSMRITKRSSGGRGEYEISEPFESMTPRDILNRSLVIDLGKGLRIPSGVVLLDRNGKRRLRIDPASGAEIHLHRQLAAALLMPYPARGEAAWGTGEPVMESDRYGIGNIDLSHVDLNGETATIVPERIEISNADRRASLDCGERLQHVRLLWERCEDFPSVIATLLMRHAHETARQRPLGPETEGIVADLQSAAASYARTIGLTGRETHDAVPFLITLLEQIGRTRSEQTDSGPGVLPVDDQSHPQIQELPSPPLTSRQGETTDHVPAAQVPEARVTGDADAAGAASPPAAPGQTVTEGDKEEEFATEVPLDESEAKQRAAPRPRRYQPQTRTIDRSRRTGTASPRQEPAERSCPLEVRLRSRTGGAFTLSLLPRRRNGMPEELEVSGAGESPLTLSAFHEAWYQDVLLAEAGTTLKDGAAWYADRPQGRLQWILSGRDLYVLGPRDDLSGYVSTPRLILGEQHAVLCIAELQDQVLALLRQCCGTTPASIDPEDGLPAGWVGFRNVCPIRSLPPSSSPDILDALRPALDVEIRLRSGIRLQYSQWLIGFPPRIRLAGAAIDAQPAVTIDGNPAVLGPDGDYTAPGWDKPGDHLVACEALTRSYSLVAPPDSWEVWPAHRQSGKLAICGAAVGEISGGAVNTCIVVPSTNPVLLGKDPGQIYFCPPRVAIRLGICGGTPPFRPVWAVPASPLQAKKTSARILLLDSFPPTVETSEQSTVTAALVRRWFQVILDCGRKGLRVSNDSPNATADWRACRDRARAIWRRTR